MIDGSPISESRWQRWFVTKDTKSFVSRLFLFSTSVMHLSNKKKLGKEKTTKCYDFFDI